MFVIYLSNKDSPSEYIKTLKNQEKNRKWPNGHFTKEDIQMTNKHEKSSISLFIKEMQIKSTMGCQHTSTGTAEKSKCWQGCRTIGTLMSYLSTTTTLENCLVIDIFTLKSAYTITLLNAHPTKCLTTCTKEYGLFTNSIKPCSQN